MRFWYLLHMCRSLLYTVNLEIFARILFSRIALKDIFVTLKDLRLEHDLHISVNDIVNSAFHKDFIFTKLGICKLSQK